MKTYMHKLSYKFTARNLLKFMDLSLREKKKNAVGFSIAVGHELYRAKKEG